MIGSTVTLRTRSWRFCFVLATAFPIMFLPTSVPKALAISPLGLLQGPPLGRGGRLRLPQLSLPRDPRLLFRPFLLPSFVQSDDTVFPMTAGTRTQNPFIGTAGSPAFAVTSLSVVPGTHGPPRSQSMKWKIPEINHSLERKHTLL